MSYLKKARRHWGTPPDWIIALATACENTSQNVVAKKLQINGGYVSYALRNQKREYHESVEDAVRGALMGQTLPCPVLGDIDHGLCARHRKSRIRPIGPEQKRLRAACPVCIHNTTRKEESDAE